MLYDMMSYFSYILKNIHTIYTEHCFLDKKAEPYTQYLTIEGRRQQLL